MSGKIQTIFKIREMRVMEDTLNKMGYSFTEENGQIVIAKRYNNIIISENKITSDTTERNEVSKIKCEYSKNLVVKDLEIEGMMYEVEETADVITILA